MDERKLSKLVRDKIPSKIRRSGDVPRCYQASDREIAGRLGNKAVEEAKEVRLSVEQAKPILVSELADMYEVLDEIMALREVSRDEVLQEQARKRAELGGFSERWILDVL